MIDLHAHTTASDGTLAPAELVREAARRGLRVLAVTDHDSTDGVEPAIAAAREFPPLEIVPGIEINSEQDGAEVHLLGYFIDYAAEWLRVRLREFREARRSRIERIVARLHELGMRDITVSEVLALVREGAAGRPHVAQVLLQKGYVSSVKEAFDRFLRNGGPAHVPYRKLEVREACAFVHQAGGVAVMAHPGFHRGADALIRELAGEGCLDGVESYYPEHAAERTRHFVGLCRELGLVPTGGSDFHGPPVRDAVLGQASVPWAAYEALRRRAGR